MCSSSRFFKYKAKHTDGWTLNQGLAAKYAADAGLDPELGAQAGEAAWDVLKSLSDAANERNPKRRAGLVARTRARLAKAGLSRHRELVRGIQQGLAELEGKGKPRASKASINPHTNLQEFSVECADEGGCRQYPSGIEVFPVTGTYTPPPPPPPFVVNPPMTPVQPIIGPPALPPASEIEYSPGPVSNGGQTGASDTALDPCDPRTFYPDGCLHDTVRGAGIAFTSMSYPLAASSLLFRPTLSISIGIGAVGSGFSLLGRGLDQWADRIAQR